MQKHTQTRHHPAITVLATEHIRSKKGTPYRILCNAT